MKLPKSQLWKGRPPTWSHPYFADAGVALMVLAVLYAPFLIPRTEQSGGFSPWAWVFMAGSALPLIWRRRFPILCLLTIYSSLLAYNQVDQAASEPIGWGILVAIYSISWAGRRWQQVFVMVLITVTSLATLESPTTAAIGMLTGVSALVLGYLARRRELRLQELAYQAGQLEREREVDSARAVAGERARIARDMHDVLAHAVSLMIVQAEAGPVVMRTKPERAERAFDAIATAGRDAMVQLRRTLGVLKDETSTGIRTPQPTVDGIPGLIAQVEETGLPVELRVTGQARPLPPDAEVAAFRIVQESLTNTLKHAAATRVSVGLDWKDDTLVITVRDDGQGGAAPGLAASGSGSGLIGIRERAAACGGSAETGPAAGGGFEVHARLPVSAISDSAVRR